MSDHREDFAQLLGRRFSCRAFRADAVPRETIGEILSMAQQSPSWCNMQPWQAIVTGAGETERLRNALYAYAGASQASSDLVWPGVYEGVYLQRRRACGLGLYGSLGIARGDREGSRQQGLENFRFFGAPHIALITTEDKLGPYGVLDAGCYVMTFMLAATCLGVASIAQAAIASRSDFLRDWFDIPHTRSIVCAISFGYADAAHPANQFRTERAPIDDAVRFVDGVATPI